MEEYKIVLIPSDNEAQVETTCFDKMVGQAEARKKISFFVRSQSKDTPIPTMLFTGSQGLGKTYMAKMVAKSMGRDLIEVNCGTYTRAEQFIDDILIGQVAGKNPKTILMDEAHQLSSEITTLLLSLLNPTKGHINDISYKDWLIEYDMSKVNLIFATTDAYKLFKPLLNRCVEVYFNIYENDELFDILTAYLPKVTITEAKEEISYACRGRARDAFILSQHIERYCTMKNIHVFDHKAWMELKDIFEIHPLGLNAQEIKLMKAIKEYTTISCANLAIKMGVNVSNIESEIETWPRLLGLIESGVRGRNLTKKGHAYIEVIK